MVQVSYITIVKTLLGLEQGHQASTTPEDRETQKIWYIILFYMFHYKFILQLPKLKMENLVIESQNKLFICLY